MLQQEQSPIQGGINAADCGIGKTCEMLGLIFHKAQLLEDDPDVKEYGATLILCPAAVISQWIEATESFFPGQFTVRQFFGTPDTVPVDRKPITLGSDPRDLDVFLGSLDKSNPAVSFLVTLVNNHH